MISTPTWTNRCISLFSDSCDQKEYKYYGGHNNSNNCEKSQDVCDDDNYGKEDFRGSYVDVLARI